MKPAWKQLTGLRLASVSLLLMAASIVKYEPWSELHAQRGYPDHPEAVRVAHNLYQSGKFANPFVTVATGYTAHVAPGFSTLVCWLFKVFGDHTAGGIALAWLPILALSLQIALLPALAPMFGYNPWTGVCAGAFALLTKPDLYDQWEAHEAGLLILVLAALVSCWANGSRASGVAWLTGILAGLTICFQPIMAPVFAVWLLLADRPLIRDRRAMPLWAIPILICAPWMLRNQLRLGTPWIRDDLGIELYVSFNDCAPYGFEQSQKQGCFGRFHPNQNLSEALALRSMGEARYNQERLRRAFVWMTRHPGHTAALVAKRTLAFWFPTNDRWPEYLRIRKRRLFFFWALTLASFGGALWSLKRRIPGGPILLTLLALFPLVYYVVQFDHRYRYPILWVTWLEAAYFCVILTERARAALSSADRYRHRVGR
jgi:hypothetical protein